MRVNVWVALRDDAQSAIVTRLTWDESTQGEYTGPVSDETALLFTRILGGAEVQRLFRVATLNSRQWTLWNLYYSNRKEVLQKVQDELDQLAIDYPNQFIIAGAWAWDSRLACRQLGTQLVTETQTVQRTVGEPNPDYQPNENLPDYDPAEYIQVVRDVDVEVVTGHTGTPTYPLHPQLIELMPDLDDVGTRPTELSDVNLLGDQPPREFS
jgi:hypothetical protein